jgi:hypothetical protein
MSSLELKSWEFIIGDEEKTMGYSIFKEEAQVGMKQNNEHH